MRKRFIVYNSVQELTAQEALDLQYLGVKLETLREM
jgi:hypothetical protein